jgi:hypothetical protein
MVSLAAKDGLLTASEAALLVSGRSTARIADEPPAPALSAPEQAKARKQPNSRRWRITRLPWLE